MAGQTKAEKEAAAREAAAAEREAAANAEAAENATDSKTKSAATKERIALNRIVIHRKGEKRQTILKGMKFKFTQEELDSIGPDAVRKPINESVEAEEPVGQPVDVSKLAQVAQRSDLQTGDPEEL